MFTAAALIIAVTSIGVRAHAMDLKSGSSVWSDRFWNVFCSGLVLAVITPIIRWMINNTDK